MQAINGLARKKRQRASGSARHQCAVNGRMPRWTAPRDVTFGRIAGRDAPQVLPVIRKFVLQINAKLSMRARSRDGILEIIRVVVALAAKIEPRVRVLMHEERRSIADVFHSFVLDGWA